MAHRVNSQTPGRRILVVGTSGSGKTTLAREHLLFIHLRSPREMRAWLDNLRATSD